MMTGDRLYLTAEEIAALTRAAISGRDGTVRVLDLRVCAGCGNAYLNPDSRDGVGAYPRWIVARLGILRDLDITSLNLTDDERVELAAFAAEHGKELVG